MFSQPVQLHSSLHFAPMSKHSQYRLRHFDLEHLHPRELWVSMRVLFGDSLISTRGANACLFLRRVRILAWRVCMMGML